MKTIVLFMFLSSGQIATIPGFHSEQECSMIGNWYYSESVKSGSPIKYKCGPGPSELIEQGPPVRFEPRPYR